MTAKQAREAIEELKAQGETEDDIISVFYQMFIDDKLSLEEFGNLLNIMDYELTEEFLNMSPEDQKTKGWADDADEAEEGVSEEEVEDAREYNPKEDEEDDEEEDEEKQRERARKLYGFKN